MPNMNGLELYRAARQAYPQLITFMITAYAADKFIQQGIAEGVKAVLSKPVDITLLLDLVEGVKHIFIVKIHPP